MTDVSHDQWLVRTTRNFISGPYSRTELCELIESGELGSQDEICRAGNYWIFLHERDEVINQLGIEPSKLKLIESEEDVTLTQTETLSEFETEEERAILPEVPELSESVTENTAVLKNRALRQFQPKKKKSLLSTVSQTHSHRVSLRTRGRESVSVERASFWRGFAWGLVLLIGVLFVWVLKILRASS